MVNFPTQQLHGPEAQCINEHEHEHEQQSLRKSDKEKSALLLKSIAASLPAASQPAAPTAATHPSKQEHHIEKSREWKS